MNEQTSNPNAAFTEIAAHKIESQDKKIDEIGGQLKLIAENTAAVNKLITVIESKEVAVGKNTFANEKIIELSTKLENAILSFNQPRENIIRHHHHFPKITWATIGLFLLVCLLGSAWYMTNSKLDNYIAGDTKYRYLKLDSSRKPLQIFLLTIDSFYNANTEMRKTVLAQEEQNKLNFERLEQAALLKEQAKELEKKVNKR